MHPEIRLTEKNRCPICFMDLIPLKVESTPLSDHQVQFSVRKKHAANIKTVRVKRIPYQKTLHLSGQIRSDETKTYTLTARVTGRVHRMHHALPGRWIKKHALLYELFSPDLLELHETLITSKRALSQKQNPAMNRSLYQASKTKFMLYDFTSKQIKQFERRGHAQSIFSILSPHPGILMKTYVKEGDHLKVGDPLYDWIDLSTVWAEFDVYEKDVKWLRVGLTLTLKVEAFPGKTWPIAVTSIEPMINTFTRTLKVRSLIPNTSLELKPGMFASAKGVALGTDMTEKKETLLIPLTAPLMTGKRTLVYIERPSSELDAFIYEAKEITLGSKTDEGYMVVSGLQENDNVVYEGAFKIDASMQIAGKTSLMHPKWHSPITNEAVLNKIDVSFPIEPYLKLSEALVIADLKAAQESCVRLEEALEPLSHKDLSRLKTQLLITLKNAAKKQNLKALREDFKEISTLTIQVLQRTHHDRSLTLFLLFDGRAWGFVLAAE